MSPLRVSIVALGILTLISTAVGQERAPYPTPPADISSKTTLVGPDEPGNRLIITGTVYKADRRTPYPGLVLFLYQTDSSGVYNPTDRNWQRPRIKGWVKTDANGHYEIRTIKPGSYPGSRNPAHIHAIVKLPDRDPEWIEDFLFEGDPFLEKNGTPDNQTRFSSIMKISKDANGVLHSSRDIVIQHAD